MEKKAWADQAECISCGICVSNLSKVFCFDDSCKAVCFDSFAATEDEIQSYAIDICPESCIHWEE